MPPPKELRRRLEKREQQKLEKDDLPKRRLPAGRSSRSILGIAVVAAAVAGAAWFATRRPAKPAKPALVVEETMNPEVAGLLDQANNAIRRKNDYSLALGYVEQALHRLEDAIVHFRAVFQSGSAQETHFLQQYILTLHRLQKDDELKAAWPLILATPGVQWRSPTQCPDVVDEAFLDDAVPFPRLEGLHVPELMAQHSKAIMKEFNEFRSQPGSKQLFKPTQDNHLVLGNDGSKWTEMRLFDRGAWDPRFCAILPTVCKIFGGLIDVEGIFNGKRSGQVSLLKLEAGAKLVPHFGSTNWRYAAHLGLQVPEGVVISGGNESRRFTQGEVVVIDDSFLHSVRHDGKGPRVTLFVTFFHPKAKPHTAEEWYARGGES